MPVVRVGHTQRFEKSLFYILIIRHAAHLFDDDAEQEIAGVVVLPFFAGRKIHGLVFEKCHEFFGRFICAHGSAKFRHIGVAANTGGVRKQVFDGDFMPLRGVIGQILGDVVLYGKFAGFFQFQNGGAGKLFGNRTDAKYMFGLHRHVQFQMRHAECLAIQHLIAFCHDGRATGAVGRKLRGKQLINFGTQVLSVQEGS